MDNKNKQHRVYLKDAEGSTYLITEDVYQGKIIQCDANFMDVTNTLTNLPNFQTRPDDIWVIDFMKSGTHWVYEIISLLLREGANSLTSSFNFMDIKGPERFKELESPRLMFTHFPLKYVPQHILENGKIVFVLRNPKSVAVSCYYHYVNIVPYEYSGTFSGHLPRFIQGVDDLYENWFDMVTAYWEYFKGKSNVHFVVYEDLKKDTVKGIQELSQFLGLDRDTEYCERVAGESKFDAMRAREQEKNAGGSKLMKANKGIIRKGSTTDWKTHFTVAQNEMFDAVYEEKMKDYPDLKTRIKFA